VRDEVNNEEIKELLKIMAGNEVQEFELEREGVRIKIKKFDRSLPPVLSKEETVAASQPVMAEAEVKPAEKEAETKGAPSEDNLYIVRSPIVGTFYRAPNPEADPFVEVGDHVEEGQVLCIVEAMKIMNEIATENTGELVKIFVENAQPVEFGQELFVIKPE
jgi:acetyl-CoA carboxylase biotin carboxyl carrier protein